MLFKLYGRLLEVTPPWMKKRIPIKEYGLVVLALLIGAFILSRLGLF